MHQTLNPKFYSKAWFRKHIYQIIKFFKAIIDGKHAEPKITAGLNGLRLLKTTKSGFVNFIQDGYRSLPDQVDRIFSTIGKRSSINNVVSNGREGVLQYTDV